MYTAEQKLKKLELINETRRRIAWQTRHQDAPYSAELANFIIAPENLSPSEVEADMAGKLERYARLRKIVTFVLHFKANNISVVDIGGGKVKLTTSMVEFAIIEAKSKLSAVRGEMELCRDGGVLKQLSWQQKLGEAPYDRGWADAAPTSF